MMTMLYTPPQKLYLPSDEQCYQEHTITDKETAANKNVLYKQISPRRRFDKFGIDKTDYKSYLLSSTVYPTAVKTTLLAELQESNPHKCGFDVVERPQAELSISLTSKASSVLNAPPPTAAQSHRGPSSTHSAPIVAFVEVHSSDMPGTRRTSVNSKSAATSVVCSDINARESDPLEDGKDCDTYPEEKQEADNVVNDVTKGTEIALAESNEEQFPGEQSRDVLNKPANLNLMQQRLARERKDKLRRSNENRLEEPKVFSYSRLDNTRLINYQWQSRESRKAEERKDGGDIRDPMYLNTFFPEERPVRFNKISLPRLTRSSRPRPWTVGESTISNRTALLIANRRSFPSAANFADRAQTTSNALPRNSWNAKSDFLALPNVRKSSSVYKVDVAHQKGEEGRANYGAWDEDTQEGIPLLEIRSCLGNSAVTDQRDKLRGKDGCLNSRVKQCVRFVRYRERLERHEAENRPMKSEGGRYRPFSKTDVRNHSLTNPPPTPEQKLQQSVETYQKYIENIARQTISSSPKHFSFRGHSTNSSRPTHASLTTASSIIDADSLIVQSVMNSNQPEVTSFQMRTPTETPRPQNSAIYTKDVSGVGDVLDIKRLSPKISTNRIVPGTRIAHEKPLSPTPRFPSASTDECVDNMLDTAPPASRGDAIVVPMVAKSECPSEYSSAAQNSQNENCGVLGTNCTFQTSSTLYSRPERNFEYEQLSTKMKPDQIPLCISKKHNVPA